jgi:hypothetical protein
MHSNHSSILALRTYQYGAQRFRVLFVNVRIAPTLVSVGFAAAAGLLAAGLVSVAPASAATTSPVPSVSIAYEGGFVAPGTDQSSLPAITGYTDGTVFTNDANSKRLDWRLARKHVASPTKLKQLIVTVAKASIAPKSGWGFPGVADVPNTRIKIAIPGYHRNLSVYALSFSNGNLTPPQVSARKKLSAAVNALVNYAQHLPGTTYLPKQYEVWDRGILMAALGGGIVTDSPSPTPGGIGGGLANPASVFCEGNGGSLSIVDEPGGQVGYCTLESGQKIEEWAYFRAEGPKLEQWPGSLKAPITRCTAVGFSKLAKEYARNNAYGKWLLPAGEVRYLLLRPVLPGEVACHRN